jgi:hypothetical protein
MNGIRPFRSGAEEQVASLYESVMRSGGRDAPPGLARYLARLFLRPGAHVDIPSLVCENAHGKIRSIDPSRRDRWIG